MACVRHVLSLQSRRDAVTADIQALKREEKRAKCSIKNDRKRREILLGRAFGIFCLRAPCAVAAVAFLRIPRHARHFPETDVQLTRLLEDRYLAAGIASVNEGLVSASTTRPGNYSALRGPEALKELTTVQWIRETNVGQARAPASEEVLSRLLGQGPDMEGDASPSGAISSSSMGDRDRMLLHRFARRWRLQRRRFGTSPDVSVSEKRTKARAGG